MPKAVIENAACEACGAEIRGDALFCYGCGAVVPAPEPEVPLDDAARTAIEPEAAASPDISEEAPGSANDSGQKKARRPLTAAMLRRKKAYNRRAIEVVWEQPTRNAMLFPIVSIVLAVIVGIILAAAMYLK